MSDSIHQMSILHEKVQKTVEKMMILHNENKDLKEQVLRSKDRIEDLEALVDEYQEEQDKIQQDIVSTLKHIESIDDVMERNSSLDDRNDDGTLEYRKEEGLNN